jgi:hypothetical protein
LRLGLVSSVLDYLNKECLNKIETKRDSFSYYTRLRACAFPGQPNRRHRTRLDGPRGCSVAGRPTTTSSLSLCLCHQFDKYGQPAFKCLLSERILASPSLPAASNRQSSGKAACHVRRRRFYSLFAGNRTIHADDIDFRPPQKEAMRWMSTMWSLSQ